MAYIEVPFLFPCSSLPLLFLFFPLPCLYSLSIFSFLSCSCSASLPLLLSPSLLPPPSPLAEFCLVHLLLARNPNVFFQHFIECVFHFNGYEKHRGVYLCMHVWVCVMSVEVNYTPVCVGECTDEDREWLLNYKYMIPFYIHVHVPVH